MAAARLRLSSRLALVTGGGSGIGRAVCQRFARDGASVAVVDIDESAAAETLRSLPSDQQHHSAFLTDVTSSESVHKLMADIQAQFSRPPCVAVNCAGITMDNLLLKMQEEAFDQVLKVNLKGTFLVTQAVAKALIASGAKKGSIINVGSIVGQVGNVGQANYTASKAGVVALTKTSAKELARFGIRCNTILPGFVDTPMAAKVPQKVLDKVLQMVPLGRLGDTSEVADACSFLASDDSSYITGASLEVTGETLKLEPIWAGRELDVTMGCRRTTVCFIQLDQHFTPCKYVHNYTNTVVTGADQRLGILWQVTHLLTPQSLSTIYNAQVRSVMEYSPFAWMGAAPTTLKKLSTNQPT